MEEVHWWTHQEERTSKSIETDIKERKKNLEVLKKLVK